MTESTALVEGVGSEMALRSEQCSTLKVERLIGVPAGFVYPTLTIMVTSLQDHEIRPAKAAHGCTAQSRPL